MYSRTYSTYFDSSSKNQPPEVQSQNKHHRLPTSSSTTNQHNGFQQIRLSSKPTPLILPHPHETMSFKQIIADPEGDLVLILRPNTADEIRILASSKHMTLVSPFFKALPQSNFKEGTELREKGRVEIPLPEEDSEAMTTLTYIIHSQFSKVPLALDLNEMTNIALMVDKYDMPVVVKKLFSDLWMDKCKEKVVKRWMSDEPTAKIPSTLCDDLHKWLFVSWIFERKAEFEETTKELILNSVHDNVCSVALPIPSSIYGEYSSLPNNTYIHIYIHIYTSVWK